MTDIYTGLAHPARRALLDELCNGPGRAGDLGHDLTMSREAVSKHLGILARAGAVTVEQRGRERWFILQTTALAEIDEWLDQYRRFWAHKLDALETEIARGKGTSYHSTIRDQTPAQEADHDRALGQHSA